MTTSSKLIAAVFRVDAKCGNMKYDFFHSKDTMIKGTFRETYMARVSKKMQRKNKNLIWNDDARCQSPLI